MNLEMNKQRVDYHQRPKARPVRIEQRLSFARVDGSGFLVVVFCED
jgi:hypothetical protein